MPLFSDCIWLRENFRAEFLFTKNWEGKALLAALVRPLRPIYTRSPRFFSSAWSHKVHVSFVFHSFSQVISQYLQSTHAPTHSDYTMTLLDVFEVEKEGEKEAFREDLHNRSPFNFWFGKTVPCLKCS